MRRFFIQRGHRRSLPILRKKFFLIGEESDGGHRIKRALYIGIKRLCVFTSLGLSVSVFVCVSVDNITEKRVNGFSWNFKDMLGLGLTI